jgi:hypothetical protein
MSAFAPVPLKFANTVRHLNYGSGPETGPAFHARPVCAMNFVF